MADLLTMLRASVATYKKDTMTIDLDVELQNLSAELVIVRQLRDEVVRPMDGRVQQLEARVSDLLARKKVSVGLGVDGPASGLYDELLTLERELNTVLADSDNQQQRNRKAIDLHGKLDRATGELETLRVQGHDVGPCGPLLTGLLDRLLREVFNIDPTRIAAPASPPRKVKPATTRKVAAARKPAAKATPRKKAAPAKKAAPRKMAKAS